MRISDWSSDVCSSDLIRAVLVPRSDRMWIPSLETLPYTRNNPSVRIFRHAMALDERRRMFRLAEWEQPQPFVPVRFRPKEWEPQDIEQRWRSEEHTSELQSLMRISYAVFCLKKKKKRKKT